jgi:hypothetical protein
MNPSATAREVWNEFCDELKTAGSILEDPATPTDAVTQAEGVRFLARVIAVGLEVGLDHADTEHPWVFLARTPTKLTGGVTPDCIYHESFIDGSRSYRIRGTRGSAPMVEIGVYAGKLGLQRESRLIGQVLETDLNVDASGTFEILLSPDASRAPDILLEPDASYIYIRNYASDWTQVVPAQFEITCEGVESPPEPLGLAQLRIGLQRAARYVQEMPAYFATTIAWNEKRATNTIVPIDPDQSTSMPGGHRLACGYFRLADGQSLVVSFRPEPAPYWSLGLCNFWMEPLDWRWRPSSVNVASAVRDADGSVRVTIGPDRPVSGNWLDTGGHPEGLINFRWARTSTPLPEIHTELVHEEASTGRKTT